MLRSWREWPSWRLQRKQAALCDMFNSISAADVWILTNMPGMADYGNTMEILDILKAMWGLKDAPRAFGMRLS
eukprot:1695909-Prorocentrum_lima.AAC.1